jgi:hypothetical protein
MSDKHMMSAHSVACPQPSTECYGLWINGSYEVMHPRAAARPGLSQRLKPAHIAAGWISAWARRVRVCLASCSTTGRCRPGLHTRLSYIERMSRLQHHRSSQGGPHMLLEHPPWPCRRPMNLILLNALIMLTYDHEKLNSRC